MCVKKSACVRDCCCSVRFTCAGHISGGILRWVKRGSGGNLGSIAKAIDRLYTFAQAVQPIHMEVNPRLYRPFSSWSGSSCGIAYCNGGTILCTQLTIGHLTLIQCGYIGSTNGLCSIVVIVVVTASAASQT